MHIYDDMSPFTRADEKQNTGEGPGERLKVRAVPSVLRIQAMQAAPVATAAK